MEHSNLAERAFQRNCSKKKLKKGKVRVYQREKLCIIKWIYKKVVTLLSTIHNPEMIEVPSHSNEVRKKPKVVMECNNTMGGVDRMNQHFTNYPL